MLYEETEAGRSEKPGSDNLTIEDNLRRGGEELTRRAGDDRQSESHMSPYCATFSSYQPPVPLSLCPSVLVFPIKVTALSDSEVTEPLSLIARLGRAGLRELNIF